MFSPDGARVLTASEDNTARLWDAASGQELRVLRGHEDAVRSAVFSPDGARVLTASGDNTARLWDAASGQELRVLRGHEDGVNSAVFSPDGARVLTASEDNTARLWDAASGQELRVLRGHEDLVGSAVFSPDGARVLTASEDNTARLWDAASGQELRVLRGHEGPVYSAVFSPDGARVLHRVRGQHRPALGRRLRPGAARPARPRGSGQLGRVLARRGARAHRVRDNTARLWDAATGQEPRVLRGHEGWVTRPCSRPTGRACSPRRRQHRPALGRRLRPGAARPARPRGSGRLAVFSPDGARVLTAS